MRLFVLLAAGVMLAACQTTNPPAKETRPVIEFFAAGNFPRDLLGVYVGDDASPNSTWGWQEWVPNDTLPIQFYPPPGYRTEITEIHGDLIAAFKIVGKDKPPIRDGQTGSVLVGYSTSQLVGYPAAGVPCNYCATGCMIYLQGTVGKEPLRIPYDREFKKPVLLEADNILALKLASFLNNTGYPLHAEATYSIIGRFVPITNP